MRLLQSLSRLVPPPSYIALPSIGVDISDTSLKYVSFVPSLRPQKVKILNLWGDITIPENVLERGEIKDSKTGETLIGASVLVKGTSEAIATDYDGNFELKTKLHP